jgi:hypothetical protein
MARPIKHVVSFATMTLLVFVATSIPSLWGGVSSGPNLDIDVGVFGWMRLHRFGTRWSIEGVDARFLIADIFIAILLTWGLSKMKHKHGSKTA